MALAFLAIIAAAAATVVVSLETHFDCGGTFGGYGESASARLDQECVDERWWRVPATVIAILATALGAGLIVRRVSVSGPRLMVAVAVIGALIGLWVGGVWLFVIA